MGLTSCGVATDAKQAICDKNNEKFFLIAVYKIIFVGYSLTVSLRCSITVSTPRKELIALALEGDDVFSSNGKWPSTFEDKIGMEGIAYC